MENTTLLIVEDDEDIAHLVEVNAQDAGYAPRLASDGYEALDLARRLRPGLVILDIMLPGLDGLGVLRELRRHSETASIPVIMLTARSQEVDRVVGFELGADDYVVKPFSPRELMLRVRAVLGRRSASRDAPEVLSAHGVVLDIAAHTARIDDRDVFLTVTEFKLLAELMRDPERVKTRDQLLLSACGVDYEGYARTVDTHVRRLRKKLGDKADIIDTVRGIGYKLKSPPKRHRDRT